MVRLLALRGAKVYFTTRSETTAQKTLIALRARSPELSQANINWLLLDMTDLTSITAASDQLKRMETRIHLLSKFCAFKVFYSPSLTVLLPSQQRWYCNIFF